MVGLHLSVFPSSGTLLVNPHSVLILLIILCSTTASRAHYHRPDQKASLVCFTCTAFPNNEECNRYAADIPCPEGHTVCKTVQNFTSSAKEPTSVIKICSKSSNCLSGHVGCFRMANVLVCTSCCTGSYCNIKAPHDTQSAIELSTVYSGVSPVAQPSDARLLTAMFVLVAYSFR